MRGRPASQGQERHGAAVPNLQRGQGPCFGIRVEAVSPATGPEPTEDAARSWLDVLLRLCRVGDVGAVPNTFPA